MKILSGDTEFAFSGSSRFRPTQNQLRPESSTLTWIHHRRVIVWSPLTIRIFPTHDFVRINNK
jgi:hypothetical protein